MLRLHLENSSDETLCPDIEVQRLPFLLGRSGQCDRSLDFLYVSRRHCYFFKKDAEVFVEDLHSCNGTYINGERVVKPRPLHDGDILDIGPLSFRIEAETEKRN